MNHEDDYLELHAIKPRSDHMTKDDGPDMDILKSVHQQIRASSGVWPTPFVASVFASMGLAGSGPADPELAKKLAERDRDALSLLAGTYAEVMASLEAMDRQLRNHAAELPRPTAIRLRDAIDDALFELASLECDRCEGRGDKRLGLIAHQHIVLCTECDQQFATCDGCKDDVLISEAIFQDDKDTTRIYHKDCAPQLP